MVCFLFVMCVNSGPLEGHVVGRFFNLLPDCSYCNLASPCLLLLPPCMKIEGESHVMVVAQGIIGSWQLG